ncbi:MAG: hypothetical protein ACUZ77_00145, partial [Candidatus Brocadiales bacterium]
ESAAELEKSVEVKPSFVKAYYALGSIYAHKGFDINKAIASYKKAIEINPIYS